MEVLVQKDILKKVVSCTSRATSNKSIQPILNNVLISSNGGSITVSATDLDLSIECKLPAEISKSGKITLPAKKFDEIVSKAPGEDVKILIEKGNLAHIKSEKSKFQINGVSPEEFPELINKKEAGEEYKISSEELLKAIMLTSFATSKFETNSILSGVNFEVSNEKFELGATDGSRLARYIGKLKEDKKLSKSKNSAVIPGRALSELERLINTFNPNNSEISFYFMPGQIIFQSSDFSLSTRLISGTFPAYDKLIPDKLSYRAVFNRGDLLGSLERVSILANERTNVVKLSFKKDGKTVRITANSPDYGNADDEIDVEYKGDNLEIAFNYRYLSEALRNLDTEKVLLELENPLSPILLKIDEKVDYDYTYLVMPVQIR
jgi:DNA polymerase-3 subunit beta